MSYDNKLPICFLSRTMYEHTELNVGRKFCILVVSPQFTPIFSYIMFPHFKRHTFEFKWTQFNAPLSIWIKYLLYASFVPTTPSVLKTWTEIQNWHVQKVQPYFFVILNFSLVFNEFKHSYFFTYSMRDRFWNFHKFGGGKFCLVVRSKRDISHE